MFVLGFVLVLVFVSVLSVRVSVRVSAIFSVRRVRKLVLALMLVPAPVSC